MNTIRELKQQEKYSNMLKRKNKEKNIYKNRNSTLRIEKMNLIKAIERKDKEIERLNDVVNKLIAKNENLMKYKRFIYNIIIAPVDWKNPYHYQLHNYTKQNLYEQLYNLRKEIIEELKGSDKE